MQNWIDFFLLEQYMGFGHTLPDELVKNISLSLAWYHQMKESGEIKALFSPEYIEMLNAEINEITSDVNATNYATCEKRLELVKLRLLLQQEQNDAKLKNLDQSLHDVKLKIQILSEENQALAQLLAAPNTGSMEDVVAQREKVEQAKQAVNHGMKFASVFAEEKEYETHRGTRYLEIKSQYGKIYPAYNDALMSANQFLSQALQVELVNQVWMILRVVLNDTNMDKVWKNLVANTSPLDGSIVKINGSYIPVPRGICNAWKELKNLKEDGSNKAEIVKKACSEMQKRLNKDGNDKKKPTNELYRVASGFLNGNELELTEAKLESLKDLLTKPMFGTLEGTKTFVQNLQQVSPAR